MRRATITTKVTCDAPGEIFGDWDILSVELKALFAPPHSAIPCAGEGGMGDWCADCRWGEVCVVETELDA